jgi:hypothetical protein
LTDYSATPLGKKLGAKPGVVQAVGLENGLVDNKSASVDETWQALRFVRRLADR